MLDEFGGLTENLKLAELLSMVSFLLPYFPPLKEFYCSSLRNDDTHVNERGVFTEQGVLSVV